MSVTMNKQRYKTIVIAKRTIIVCNEAQINDWKNMSTFFTDRYQKYYLLLHSLRIFEQQSAWETRTKDRIFCQPNSRDFELSSFPYMLCPQSKDIVITVLLWIIGRIYVILFRFYSVFVSGDGKITFPEFCKHLASWPEEKDTSESLIDAFKVYINKNAIQSNANHPLA